MTPLGQSCHPEPLSSSRSKGLLFPEVTEDFGISREKFLENFPGDCCATGHLGGT